MSDVRRVYVEWWDYPPKMESIEDYPDGGHALLPWEEYERLLEGLRRIRLLSSDKGWDIAGELLGLDDEEVDDE